MPLKWNKFSDAKPPYEKLLLLASPFRVLGRGYFGRNCIGVLGVEIVDEFVSDSCCGTGFDFHTEFEGVIPGDIYWILDSDIPLPCHDNLVSQECKPVQK